MTRIVLCVLVVLCASVAFGQGYVPYTPGSTANVPPLVPVPPQAPPQSQMSVPQEWMQYGYREEFKQTHDVYPFRQEVQPVPQQTTYYPAQQWAQPTQQLVYPQQQYYCQPRYCYPQQQYYYYQPQRNWWNWCW